MGNSTGSMFYAFGAFLLIYLVGASIYQIYLWIKKWRENREEGSQNGRYYHYINCNHLAWVGSEMINQTF